MHYALALFLFGTGVVCLLASATGLGFFLMACAPAAWVALR